MMMLPLRSRATRILVLTIISCAALLALPSPARADVMTGLGGRLAAFNDGNAVIPLQTDLVIHAPGWKSSTSLDDLPDRGMRFTRDGAQRQWEGALRLETGQSCRYRQVLTEDEGGTVTLQLTLTPEADVPAEGAYFHLYLPQSCFLGGSVALTAGERKRASFPETKPAKPHLLWGNAQAFEIRDAAGAKKLTIALDKPRALTVQDDRAWGSSRTSIFTPLRQGTLRKGETATLTVRIRAESTPDRSPATLTVNAGRALHDFDGCGGTYCFGLDSPITSYTLEQLRSGWARTEMSMDQWAPTAADCPDQDANWARPAANDQPGRRLHRELLMAQTLHRRGIPFIISIWRLPEWLYSDPGKGPRAYHRSVAPERWNDLLRCIGSYLLYAKAQYGAEPDLFSFNEPDWGVNVHFSPEAHRDAIKSIGAHLERLGLKTKMLLGDVTNPRDTDDYTTPTLADPAALRHVGAVSFHSWGGGTPAQYAAWRAVAERAGRPLLVGEMGVDAQAHRYFEATRNYAFVLQEIRMYQELLLHARPRAIMQWEFTNDYPLLERRGDALEPTKRFWIDKHFCNLTPPRAKALETASDKPAVLLTAFRGQGGALALHVANLEAAREIRITGLPAGLQELRAVRTNATDSFKEIEPVKVTGGEVKMMVPAQTLLTLSGQ